MPSLTPTHYALITNNLNEFITTLKNSGYNISTTHYVSAHQLLNALAAQQQLPSDANQLSQLLMPLLCCCEKEQLDFPRRFSFWLGNLQPDNSEPTQTLDDDMQKIIKETKTFKKRLIFLVVVLLVTLCSFVFYEETQQLIQTQAENFFPIPDFEQNVEFLGKESAVKNPLSIIPETLETQVQKPIAQAPYQQFKKYSELVAIILAILLAAIVFWWIRLYIKTHQFLTRHSVSSPPELKSFFLNKPRPLFALLDFTFTAQQLHKHRHIASNYLDPQSTIKQTLAKAGIFTPCYQTLRAVPEYLVLIDRSSFKDQLAASVSDFIQQLTDFGLFMECFYFDEDPRRCYRQGETRPQALEGLLANYPSHRLLVFSDSGHFIDPSTGQLNHWASEFAHSQQPVLFTFTGLQAFGMREAMLHEAGFVVLPWDDDGFETLLQHFDEEREAIDFVGTEEHASGSAGFPVLVRRRAQRFLERHRPNEELTTRLLQELKSYLGADGFFWLAACAVYPQLESQLTLHLGYALLGEENFAQSLFIRLLRLPWFRHGFMPDWLRWLLLANLTVAQDKQIRAVIYQLLLNASAEQEGKSFKLEVAKEGEVLHWAKRIVKVWTRRAAKEHELKDFVFQSFLQGKLSVKVPSTFPHLFNFTFLLRKFFSSIFLILQIKNIEEQDISNQRIKESIQEPDKNISTQQIEENITNLNVPSLKKILLVDDHELVRTGIRALLQNTSLWIVEVADSGEKAVEMVNQEHFDLVLMDINMPGIGGIEATRLIREKFTAQQLPILAFSGGSIEVRKASLRVGMNGYLEKNYSIELISAIIEEHLSNVNKPLKSKAELEIDFGIFEENLKKLNSSNNVLLFRLSEREYRVFCLILKNYDIYEIAQMLELSHKTVNTYRYRIYKKLNVKSDVELIQLAENSDYINSDLILNELKKDEVNISQLKFMSMSQDKMIGIIKIKHDEKGFGFISPADGGNKDLFFHFSGCIGGINVFNELQPGMEVSFETQDGQKGLMAVEIEPI